jgi:hypothetical protein
VGWSGTRAQPGLVGSVLAHAARRQREVLRGTADAPERPPVVRAPDGELAAVNHHWWNTGGWNNTRTAVEQAVDGGKSALIAEPGSAGTGRARDTGIKVRGRRVTLHLDGQGWGKPHRRQAGRAVPPGRHPGREDR